MKHYWDSSDGSLHLELTLAEAQTGSHQGDCEEGVLFLLSCPHIAKQAAEWNQESLKEELRGYGAWDDAELADEHMNRVRMLWLACGSIVDEAA